MTIKHTPVYENLSFAMGWNGYSQINYEIVTKNPIQHELTDVSCVQTKIQQLEQRLLEMPQADIVTLHEFLPNTYERKMIAPKSAMIVGAAHKTSYKVRLEKGTITVNVGFEVKTLTAPCEFDAPAGEQRVGYTHDEVIWVDIYDNPDNCTNIDALEERLYVIPECGLGDYRKRNGLSLTGEKLWLDGQQQQ